MTTPDLTAWYWGSLRAAAAADQWERAWALIAAWPCYPPEAAAEAHRYLLRAAAEEEDPEPVTAASGLLEYYRALPVPVLIHASGEATGPHSFLWRSKNAARSLTGRRFPQHNTATSLYWQQDIGLGLEGAWSKDTDGGLVLDLRGVKPSQDLPPHAEGVRAGAQDHHSGEDSTDWDILCLKGSEAIEEAALLLRRFSREMDAMRPGSSLKLAWPLDILKRLWADGPAAHPSLSFTKGYSLPYSASALRENMAELLPNVIPIDRLFHWRANEETNTLMRDLNEALRALDPNLNWRVGLVLLDMTSSEVLEATGTDLDSAEGQLQIRRWEAVQEARGLAERLTDAMRRSRSPRTPPNQPEPSPEPFPEEDWAEDLGPWSADDPAEALYHEVVGADWGPPEAGPQTLTEVLAYARYWEQVGEYQGDDPETLQSQAALAPHGDLLRRFLAAARDAQSRRGRS